MSRSSASARSGLPGEVSALVRIGLAEFWQQALPLDDALLSLLQSEAKELLGRKSQWSTHRKRMAGRWAKLDGPFGRFVRDHGLTIQQAFVVALAGEIESSHLVTLVVSTLQSPAATSRPTVHLCVAMSRALFGSDALNTEDILEMPLVRARILKLDDDAPVPLRTLRIHPSLWAVLCGHDPGWDECRPLIDRNAALLPEALREDLPYVAGLIGDARIKGLVVRGNPGSGRDIVAAELAAALGRRAISVPVERWRDEPALAEAAHYANWLPVLRPHLGPGEAYTPPEHANGPVVIVLGTDGAVAARDYLGMQIGVPRQAERLNLWVEQVGNKKLAAEVAGNSLLSGSDIVKVAQSARLIAGRRSEKLGVQHIAEARRELGADQLRQLAQAEDRMVTDDAIVLSPQVASGLAHIVARTQRRESMWSGLGPTLQASRTSGVRAMFVGESGTGKTLAASYVATRLGAPLYRVDLSAVMNKYIGESEKNLANLLDHAAASDVLLLFDEADSIFGRRSDGGDTGERYANMLTNFLLTRIEHHPGVVLLTTNSRDRIDEAFMRRLDRIVDFPLPGFEQRLQLWQKHLGKRGPGADAYRTLASYCDLAGGQIRNVVLSAAVSSAGESITTEHLMQGLVIEYQKTGRELPAKLSQLRKEIST